MGVALFWKTLLNRFLVSLRFLLLLQNSMFILNPTAGLVTRHKKLSIEKKMEMKISESIEKLKFEKRIIANKVIEFSNAFKNTIAKLEKKYEEKFTAFENKLEKLENERIPKSEDQIKSVLLVVEKHSDDISKLENEYSRTDELLKEIDKNLLELEIKILECNEMIENLKLKEAKDMVNDEEVKQCIYDRSGFCRENNDCQFFHSEEICDIYLGKRICWKEKCRKRHPKTCWYFQRGYCKRGESCRYLHENLVSQKPLNPNCCDRCEIISERRYFCEFCRKNFCHNCTAKSAHIENIYIKDQETPNCSDVHC